MKHPKKATPKRADRTGPTKPAPRQGKAQAGPVQAPKPEPPPVAPPPIPAGPGLPGADRYRTRSNGLAALQNERRIEQMAAQRVPTSLIAASVGISARMVRKYLAKIRARFRPDGAPNYFEELHAQLERDAEKLRAEGKHAQASRVAILAANIFGKRMAVGPAASAAGAVGEMTPERIDEVLRHAHDLYRARHADDAQPSAALPPSPALPPPDAPTPPPAAPGAAAAPCAPAQATRVPTVTQTHAPAQHDPQPKGDGYPETDPAGMSWAEWMKQTPPGRFPRPAALPPGRVRD